MSSLGLSEIFKQQLVVQRERDDFNDCMINNRLLP